eukprot:scaffold4489_cov26-Tisochrysis_lutea.AAC.4
MCHLVSDARWVRAHETSARRARAVHGTPPSSAQPGLHSGDIRTHKLSDPSCTVHACGMPAALEGGR